MSLSELTERERRVLEAVIRSYVETAEPAGSRTLSRRYGLGVSPATIRNTMSDLEEKGFLFHPHTSAGRVPTDKAYRLYVDGLDPAPLTEREREILGFIGQGRNNAEIAQRLTLSGKTIRNHITNIFSKLQVADRAQAIILARDAGLGKK